MHQPQHVGFLDNPHPGSSYNAELLVASYEALGKLREELWPGVENEPALGIGQGGEQVSYIKSACFYYMQ